MSKTNQTSQDEIPVPDFIIDNLSGKRYKKGKFFGKGGFAKCYVITDESTNKTYAGKVVSKKLLAKNNQKEKMVQEIQIHKSLKNKNVVGFHSFFDDEHFVYIVLELCGKRSMMELHRRRKTLTEPEVRYFMKQILEGVLYLHDKGIIHRDLKLGNLFINDDVEVKIGDFGLAAKIEYSGQRKKTLCGTPNYIAPEILNKKGHSFEVDVWSIGCIMYTLFMGKPPFETSTLKETYSRIKRCEYRLPLEIKRTPAGAIIMNMLQADPDKRPSVRQILQSEFMTQGFLPSQLPVSCLTMAPRNDTLFRPGSERKPLIELTSNEHSPVPKVAQPLKPSAVSKYGMGKPKNARLSVPATGSLPSAPTKVSEECADHLQSLAKQLFHLVSLYRNKDYGVNPQMATTRLPNIEELTDPDSQPFVWISKWVDYSDKYGFGYQLCDDGVGVMFNDQTRIILLPNLTDVHYIERNGEEYYYTMDNTPAEIEKKMRLLTYFRRYMTDHLIKAGEAHARQECDRFTRVPYMLVWKRSSSAVTMQLTNGTIQVNFMDHSKIIVCPLMSAVTYIDEQKNFRTFRLKTLESYITHPQFARVAECLQYVYKKIPELLAT